MRRLSGCGQATLLLLPFLLFLALARRPLVLVLFVVPRLISALALGRVFLNGILQFLTGGYVALLFWIQFASHLVVLERLHRTAHDQIDRADVVFVGGVFRIIVCQLFVQLDGSEIFFSFERLCGFLSLFIYLALPGLSFLLLAQFFLNGGDCIFIFQTVGIAVMCFSVSRISFIELSSSLEYDAQAEVRFCIFGIEPDYLVELLDRLISIFSLPEPDSFLQ